jgi:hypothetical protein
VSANALAVALREACDGVGRPEVEAAGLRLRPHHLELVLGRDAVEALRGRRRVGGRLVVERVRAGRRGLAGQRRGIGEPRVRAAVPERGAERDRAARPGRPRMAGSRGGRPGGREADQSDRHGRKGARHAPQ